MLSKRRLREIGEAFSARKIRMLRSPAYRVLSLGAHRVLDRIEIEHHHHSGKPDENGKLVVTYEDFVEFGMHRHAIGPAIRELVTLGFVEVTVRGHAGNAAHRRPSKYRLTYRPTANILPTDEWVRFREVREAEVAAAAARRNKKPVTENAKPQCRGIRHRKRPFSVPESALKSQCRNPSRLSILWAYVCLRPRDPERAASPMMPSRWPWPR